MSINEVIAQLTSYIGEKNDYQSDLNTKINLSLDKLATLSINDLSNIIQQINIQNEQIEFQLQENEKDSNKSNVIKSQYQGIEIDKIQGQNKILFIIFYILVFILAGIFIYKKEYSFRIQIIIIILFIVFPFVIYYLELLLFIIYKYSVNFVSSTPFSNVYITNY